MTPRTLSDALLVALARFCYRSAFVVLGGLLLGLSWTAAPEPTNTFPIEVLSSCTTAHDAPSPACEPARAG